jgi:4-hydroxybenzoate polyprenyltransferase
VTTLAGLVRACHPEPAVAVTAIAAGLAWGAGAPVLRVAGAFAAGQLATGWSNDWIDRDRDLRTGRTDKPVVQGSLSPGALRTAAGLATAACVPLSLALGARAGCAHLAAVGSALSYNALLKSGPLSFLPYAVSFGLLPEIVVLATPGGGLAPPWASAAGALLGVGAHLANALPDLEDDLAMGVRGLPHRLGRPLSTAAMAGLLLTATGLLAYGPGEPGRAGVAALVVAGALTTAGIGLSRRPGSRAAFLAAVSVAVVDVALLLARGAELTGG